MTSYLELQSELQITVGHETSANQNLCMSYEIPKVVRDDVQPFFDCKLIYGKAEKKPALSKSYFLLG